MRMRKTCALVACGALVAALGLFGCSSGGGESQPAAGDGSADGAATEEPAVSQPAGEDIVPVEGTVESPAQMGEWLPATIYSVEDDADHIIYYRFTSVETDAAAVQEAIDAYNNSDSIFYISELDADDADDMMYITVGYEMYIPEDTVLSEYGASVPNLYFSLYGTDGGSIEANGYTYIGLHGEDITVDGPDSVFPGDAITGTYLFSAPQNVSEMLIQGDYTDPETEESIETNTLLKL